MTDPTDPRSSHPSRGDKKSPLSKRFISRKIEEMLQSTPPPTENKHIGSLLPKQDRRNRWKFRKPLLWKRLVGVVTDYPLMVILGVVIAAGWLLFFISHYRTVATNSMQIEKITERNNGAPILSTPILSDVDGDGKYDIAFADSLGYLRAINPRSQEMIFETYLGGELIASLAAMEVDGKPPMEIFAANQTGKFFTINQLGDYLYQSREEFFTESLLTKPLILQTAGVFFLAGMGGKVWGVGINYGEVRWMNNNSILTQNQEGVFAPLTLFPLQDMGGAHARLLDYLERQPNLSEIAKDYALLAVGEKGSAIAIDIATGGVKWQTNLQGGVKAAPLVWGEGGECCLLLAGVGGGIWLLNNRGELLDRYDSEESFVSSPVSGKFLSSQTQAILISESGKLFLISVSENTLGVKTILTGNEAFIATPIAADWNLDGQDDILAVSREGTLYLWSLDRRGDGEILLSELTPPFRLNYKVTATPVVGDINRDAQAEIFIAGENGKLTMLTLRTSPPVISPGQIISSQFLSNPFHSR